MTLGDYCSVRRKDGVIIIEVPEADMLDYFRRSDPEFPRAEDPEALVQGITERLLEVEVPTEDDGFTTCLEELFRRAALESAQNDEQPGL